MATTDPARSASSPSTAAPDADLESLEQEREFLLRSLADLDAELEAGDIDDDDYRSRTDDYTARAAAVLKAIEAVKAPGARGNGTRARPPGKAGGQSVVPSHRRPAA